MTNDIKEYVSLCSTCKSYETANAKEPLLPHDIPDRPWAKAGIDLFSLNNQDYLITVDYFSGFSEVDKLKDTTSMTVITKLKAHFARYGSPEVVVSDNGPQFSCLNFNIFAKKWDFEHRPSSPGNSKANGKAEAAVKVAKNLMKKAIDAKSDVYLLLLDLRNTPTQGQETSPAQRSLGRRTRTLLPTTTSLLKPTGIPSDIKTRIHMNQQKQKVYFDRRTKPLAPLEEDDMVRIQPFTSNKKTWSHGEVLRRLDDRSYDIKAGNQVIGRNRVHLKPTNENPLTSSVNMPVVSIPPPQPAPINVMPPPINVTPPRIEAMVPIPTSPVAGSKETAVKASTQRHENNLPRTSRTGRQIRTPS